MPAALPSPVEPRTAGSLARASAAVGIPKDAVRRFAAASYLPIPKQLHFHAAAHACDYANGPTDVGLGGARGGAKSHGVLAQLALDDCQRQAGLKCLWLRQVGISAREALEDLMPRVLRLPHSYVGSPVPTIRFPNGSRILVGHFNAENDIARYLGLEYDVIATEEATQLSPAKHAQIGTCLRTSKPGWRVRRYYTTNPGGVGHAYFKRLFIEPFRKGLETATRFIPSTFRDNPYLNPEYVTTLDRLSGWLRAAWRDGDWDAAAGQYFNTWNHEAHVRSRKLLDEIPSHWPVWCAMDYGYQHPTAVLLFAEYDGVVRVVDECGGAKKLVPDMAAEIKAMLGRHAVKVERLRSFVTGSDTFSKEGGMNEKSRALEFQGEGIRLSLANMDRKSGWGEILRLLGDPANGRPARIMISDRCAQTIEQLPALQHDDGKPDDVLKTNVDEDGNGGDDYADCLRYGIMLKKPAPIGLVRVGGY